MHRHEQQKYLMKVLRISTCEASDETEQQNYGCANWFLQTNILVSFCLTDFTALIFNFQHIQLIPSSI